MKRVFWLLVATVLCAGAVFWFVTSRDGAQQPERTAETSAAERQASPAVDPGSEMATEDQGESRSGQAGVEDSGVAPNAPDVQQIIVDSFDPSERVPLEAWTSVDEFVGHFDVFARDSDGAAVEEGLLLGPADLLIHPH